MTAAIAVGVLVAAGVYLILQRGLIRIAIGFVLLGHAVNVLLISAGGLRLRGEPLIGAGEEADMADPLPQAFVLTAIVITFGITVFLLALARAGGSGGRSGQRGERPEPSADNGTEATGDKDAQPVAGERSEPADRRPEPHAGDPAARSRRNGEGT